MYVSFSITILYIYIYIYMCVCVCVCVCAHFVHAALVYMRFTYGSFNKHCLLINKSLTDCIVSERVYGLDDLRFESP